MGKSCPKELVLIELKWEILRKSCPSKWVASERNLYRRVDQKTGARFPHFPYFSIINTEAEGQYFPSYYLKPN